MKLFKPKMALILISAGLMAAVSSVMALDPKRVNMVYRETAQRAANRVISFAGSFSGDFKLVYRRADGAQDTVIALARKRKNAGLTSFQERRKTVVDELKDIQSLQERFGLATVVVTDPSPLEPNNFINYTCIDSMRDNREPNTVSQDDMCPGFEMKYYGSEYGWGFFKASGGLTNLIPEVFKQMETEREACGRGLNCDRFFENLLRVKTRFSAMFMAPHQLITDLQGFYRLSPFELLMSDPGGVTGMDHLAYNLTAGEKLFRRSLGQFLFDFSKNNSGGFAKWQQYSQAKWDAFLQKRMMYLSIEAKKRDKNLKWYSIIWEKDLKFQVLADKYIYLDLSNKAHMKKLLEMGRKQQLEAYKQDVMPRFKLVNEMFQKLQSIRREASEARSARDDAWESWIEILEKYEYELKELESVVIPG